MFLPEWNLCDHYQYLRIMGNFSERERQGFMHSYGKHCHYTLIELCLSRKLDSIIECVSQSGQLVCLSVRNAFFFWRADIIKL